MNKILRPVLILLVLVMALPAAVYSATGAVTVDPEIPRDDLKLKLKPLMRAELKVEADAWLQLLEDKAREISTAEIAVKDKLREVSTAEKLAAALDDLEAVKNKADEAPDAEEARTSIRAAEQAFENALAETRAAVARVTDNEDTIRVTTTAARVAAEKAAAEQEAAGEQDTEAGPSEDNEDDAAQTETDIKKKKIDAAVAKRNIDRDNLIAYLADLRGQRTGLIDRTKLVIDAFEVKGGAVEDVEEYQQYVAAVSGIEVDVTDVSATWATITGWLISEEGGLRWLKNISLFLGIVLASMFLARLVGKAVKRVMANSSQTSQLLGDFLVTTSRRLVLAIGIIIGLAALEVNIGPLLAVIGAAGFVVAFALQSSLGNFASGILIMVFKPFDVGDLVEIGGVLGKVKSMNLLSVLVRTPDNKAVIIPNNNVWGDSITNVTQSDTRRVDMEFGIGYGDDIETAQNIMEQVVAEHSLVLKDPEPVIRVHELADSSVNFVCRPWVKTENYWEVYWDLTRTVKERFDAGGVSIPFPQQDVHVIEALRINSDAGSNETQASAVKAPGTATGSKQASRAGNAGGSVDLDDDV